MKPSWPSRVKARAGYAGAGIEAQWQDDFASDDLALRLRQARRQLAPLAERVPGIGDGPARGSVATFRATVPELQPKLKIFLLASSREVLNSMFR